MTVIAQDPINQVLITGGETVIPYTWFLELEAEIVVQIQAAAGGAITTLILGVDYTVDPAGLKKSGGGNISPIGAQLPVTAGDIWTMFRDTKLNRATDFAISGDFLAPTVNNQLDKITRMNQDSNREAEQALRKDPAVGDTLDPLIPQPVDRRTLVLSDKGGGDFELVMSEFDPDQAQGDAEGFAEDAENSAIASAASAADSAQSASDSQDSADASSLSADESAQSADDAENSAAAAAAIAAGAEGLYSRVIPLLTVDADFSGNSFFHNDDTAGSGFVWNDIGTKFFIVGTQFDTVNEYTVSIPFDLTSTIVQTNFLDVNFKDNLPTGLAWNNDGTQLFITGNQNNKVYEFSLSVGFDLGSTVAFENDFEVTTQDNNPQSVSFNNTGSKMFVLGDENDKVYEYLLSAPFNISSPSFTADFVVGNEDGAARGLAWNNDGTKFLIVGETTEKAYEYSLTVGFDLSSTVLFTGNSMDVDEDSEPRSIAFNNDGTKFYILGASNASVFEYNATGTYSLAPGTTVYTGNSADVSGQDISPQGAAFNNDGTKFFIVGADSDTVYEFTVSVGFDLSSTVVFSGNSFSVVSEENEPLGIAFNNDGTKFFIVGNQNDTVFEYTVSVGFDLSSTVAFSGESFSVSGQDSIATGIVFNNDGTKFFISGNQNTTVFEYTVSVGFDLSSTVAFSGNSLSVVSEDATLTGLAFNNDGTKLFTVGGSTDAIFEHTVSVGFDLSSAVAFSGNSFGVGSEDTSPNDIVFNNDGTKFFIVGEQNDNVYEYLTSKAFSVAASAVVVGVVPESNGALFSGDTSNIDLTLDLIDSSTLIADFRVGVTKNSSDSNSVIVSSSGSDSLNGVSNDIIQISTNKIVTYVLDQSEAKWVGSPIPFRGALVHKSTTQSISTSVLTVLTWQLVEYDTSSLHNPNINNARLIVPDGVSRIILRGGVNWDNSVIGGRDIGFRKNAAVAAIGLAETSMSAASSSAPEQNITSAVMSVVPGDFFDMTAFQSSGGNLNILNNNATFFSMEIVE